MGTQRRDASTRRMGALISMGAVAAVSVTGCAGGVSSGGAGSGVAGQGFEYGAAQEEVDRIIEDLDPVTLRFQPVAASPTSIASPAGTVLKEMVEERSGGKIEVEIVWGQAIAGYADIPDALADGRLDLAYDIPTYSPAEFPAVDDLATTTALLPSSPYLGEFLPHAVYNDIGWTNQAVLDEYEARGVVPLTPFIPSAGYYMFCSESAALDGDWRGTQVRIGSAAQSSMTQDLGAAPVSMEHTEVYEALQRGTVDCNLGPAAVSAESGLVEVGAHVGFTTDVSFPRAAGAFLAGSSFNDLPLAYQQIVFDSNALASGGVVKGQTDGAAEVVRQAKEHGGGVVALDEDTQGALKDASESLTDEAVGNGRVDADIAATIAESVDRWVSELEEAGFADQGDTESFDEWYDDSADFNEFARLVYESSAAMEHRPS